jgi:hypothetical protein
MRNIEVGPVNTGALSEQLDIAQSLWPSAIEAPKELSRNTMRHPALQTQKDSVAAIGVRGTQNTLVELFVCARLANSGVNLRIRSNNSCPLRHVLLSSVGLHGRERLLEIGDQVFFVFNPHGEPYQPFGNANAGALFVA